MTKKAPPPPDGRFRFTRDQYYEMGRLGYFEDRRVELLFGEIVEKSLISWRHALGVGLVSDALAAAFAGGYWTNQQQPFTVPGVAFGSEPQPDVAMIPGAKRAYTDHPTAAAWYWRRSRVSRLCRSAGVPPAERLRVGANLRGSDRGPSAFAQRVGRPRSGKAPLRGRRTPGR